MAPENSKNERLVHLEAQVDSLRKQLDACRERERWLRQKEEVLHATLESAADGILAVDREGQIIFSNREFSRMWRIPPDLIENGDDNELMDFVLEQLVEPESFLAKTRDLYHSIHESRDLLHFRDNRVFERFSKPLVIENELSGRVWTFRDVTPAANCTG